jgi:glycosyltransferase involved in cell wall biosynthesis
MLTAFACLNARAPVIHDCHDITTILGPSFENSPKVRQEEQIVNSLSQGQIYVSEMMREYLKHSYGLDLPNSIIFPCYSTVDVIPRDPLPRLSEQDAPDGSWAKGERHICYEGGISNTPNMESHRYYFPLFKKLCEQGIHVHVHTAVMMPSESLPSSQWKPDVQKYFHWQPTMSPPLFIRAMSAYDANIVGFHGNTKFTDMSFPNKLFEGASAGLPCICTDHKTIRQFVEQEKIGHVIDYLNPKIDWEYLDKCRERVEKKRWDWTHEAQVDKIIGMYEAATELRKP